MNIMEEKPSVCGRCGNLKSTFQTIKFADIFTHLHAHEGQGECQCGDLPPQQNRHYQNGTGNIATEHSPSTSSGVTVIQHHTHNPQYLNHGSHHQIHQQPQEQHLHHNNAFIPVFHHELEQDRHQNVQQQQQHLFLTNEFDTHPHLQQQLDHPQLLIPNYTPPTTATTYITVVAGDSNRGPPIETKVPISVVVKQSPQQPQLGVGVITKNQNKEVMSTAPLPPPPKPPRIPCSLCKKSFVNEKMLKTHVERVHEKKSRFVCEICGVAFSYRGSLDSHLCSHTSNPAITFDCPTCGQKFKQKSNLAQHMKHHSEDNPKKFLCPHCPSGFSKRVNLRYHIRRLHPGAEEGEVSGIIATRVIPPPPSQQPTTISSIGSNKRKKDKSQNQGNGQFKCDECGRSFLFKNTLKAHSRTHSKEKKYSCVECEKSFMYKESLKNHMLLHSNQLPYSCEICNKQFRDRSNRRKHVKNVHKYLFLNNNNTGENGLGSTETLNGGSSGSVAVIGVTGPTAAVANTPKKKKANKKTNQAPTPVPTVIKKTRKRVKKVGADPLANISVPTTTSSTTSVIVSNSLVGPGEVDRKIIMSPGPRQDYQPLHPHPSGAGNVIMKTPITTNAQMQNVIVYPNPQINNKSVISNGGNNFQHFTPSDLQNQQVSGVFTTSEIKQELSSSTTPTSNGGRGGFQHFTLSRGIITASSAVTNNVHYNYEPQSQQPPQQQYWDDTLTQTQAISHHEPYSVGDELIQSPHQYATTSSNIVYSSSAGAAIQHGSNIINMQNNSLQQNNAGTSDPNVEHLDLFSQNGSAFSYKDQDLSQFDFSYL